MKLNYNQIKIIIVSIIILNFLDIFTTYFALKYGVDIFEANPIYNFTIKYFGLIIGLIVPKLFVFVVALSFYILWIKKENYRDTVEYGAIFVNLLYIFIVLNNIYHIIGNIYI